jgi:hypothetical protein
MPSTPSIEERRLAFEARRLAAETLTKVYLEHTQAARQLVVAYLRQMFTLTIGLIAGVVTLYGALLRFGPEHIFNSITYIEVALALFAISALISSALITASALQRAAFHSVNRLSSQAPEIEEIFQNQALEEREILLKLYAATATGFETQVLFKRETRVGICLLIIGLLSAVASFLL